SLRLRRIRSALEQPEMDVDRSQLVAEFGDGGVLVGKLLLDRECRANFRLRVRARRHTCIDEQRAEAAVAGCQTAAEFSARAILVGKLLPYQKRRADLGLRFRPPAGVS